MPHAQPDSVEHGNRNDTESQLNAIHAGIVGSDAPDYRYIQKLSNKTKVARICAALKIKPEAFGIARGQPFDDLLREHSQISTAAGLYLSDLRIQFYTAIKKKMDGPSDAIEQMIADNEWWHDKFGDVLFTLNTGELPDKKVLH